MLLDSNLAFFIYTVPQNILFSLTLLLIFYCLQEYRVSKYIRKFYFIKSVLATALLEENLTYFIFVCFSHLNISFIFRLVDKISLVFTVLYLFGLILFSLCFYPLICQFLKKKSVYFSQHTFARLPGFWYKTMQLVIRGGLRAVVFCFYSHRYTSQLAMLIVL